MDFYSFLNQKAQEKKNRIGIGLAKVTPRIESSLRLASEFAEIIIIGNPVDGFESIESNSINPLLEMVRDGKVDGMVRGNFDALVFYNAIREVLGHEGAIREVNLLQLNGLKMIDEERKGIFALVGVSPSNERTTDDKIEQIDRHIEFFEQYNVDPKIGLLSAGKPDDIKEGIVEVSVTIEEALRLEKKYTEKGYAAKHYNHQIEYAAQDDCNIIVAPTAIAGNLAIHVMLYMGTTDFLGGIATNVGKYVIVDDSEAMQDFSQCIKLANAMVNATIK